MSSPRLEAASIHPPFPDLLGGWEIFQHRPFAEIVARHHHVDIEERGGMLLLGRRRPLVGMLSARLLGPEASGEGHWWRRLEERRCGTVDVLTNRPIPDGEARKMSPDDLFTLLVDLNEGEEAVFARVEHRCRKAVRRANREGLEVVKARSDAESAAFHARLRAASGDGERYPIPTLELIDDLLAEDLAVLHVARLDNEIVGGIVTLQHRYAHSWLMCLDPTIARGLSNNALVWESIRHSIARGIRWYDLGSHSLSALPQITMAKRAFSPLLIPAYRYSVVESAWRNELRRSAESVFSSLGLGRGDGLSPGS